MSEEEASMTKEEMEIEKLNREIAKLKNWWKKPSYAAALFPTVLVLAASVYGFANGYFQTSSAKLENRVIKKQTEELQTEIAEISRRKDALEQKRVRILERLAKTRNLVESSKNPSAEVKAHIEVESSACLSCPPPAWVESQREIFAALEEIEKVLDEDAPAR